MSSALRVRVLLLWAVWSGIVLFLATAAASLPVSTAPGWERELAAPPLARWDSGWYAGIAKDGYRYDPAVAQNNVGFYPLYPLLVRLVAGLFHAPLFATGTAVSLLCLLAALLIVAELAAESSGADRVLPTTAALLLFPSAFFFAAFYTESLFLLTTAGALWSARRARWTLSGIFALAAGLTRFNGALIAVPLLWLAWEARRLDRRWPLRQAPALAGALAGALAYPVYLWARWGDPLLYVRSKASGWGKAASPFWRIGPDAVAAWRRLGGSGGSGAGFFLQLACTLLFVGLTVVLFRRRRTAEGLYAATTLLLLVSSGDLSGTVRFVLALFPCFVVLAEVLEKGTVPAFAYAFLGTGLAGVLLHRFVHWLFVA